MFLRSGEARALQWRTPRRSLGNGACVEAASGNREVFVRDSQDRGGAVMQYSEKSWRVFLADVKSR